jgi:hypothetical protein
VEPEPGARSTALPRTPDWQVRDPEPREPQYREPRARAPARSTRQGYGEAFAKSMLRTIGSQVGRQLIRGVLGSLTRR